MLVFPGLVRDCHWMATAHLLLHLKLKSNYSPRFEVLTLVLGFLSYFVFLFFPISPFIITSKFTLNFYRISSQHF